MSEIIKPDFSKDPNGLIPAIAQDAESGEVLMLAYVNEEAWEETVNTGRGVYWSRSRQQLWRKGDTSGNVQLVKEILIDCDRDTLIFKVEQVGGAACHEGYSSCFFRKVTKDSTEIVSERVFDPKKVYNK
ncbi:MAG: phosphoribosyl-AMP cyclohydrolase [Lentisphaeraceae bacterium]|nr:phosphoribosyl-AMP cyclohydrolase [Lentisphaeraceae bacterium]